MPTPYDDDLEPRDPKHPICPCPECAEDFDQWFEDPGPKDE